MSCTSVCSYVPDNNYFSCKQPSIASKFSLGLGWGRRWRGIRGAQHRWQDGHEASLARKIKIHKIIRKLFRETLPVLPGLIIPLSRTQSREDEQDWAEGQGRPRHIK